MAQHPTQAKEQKKCYTRKNPLPRKARHSRVRCNRTGAKKETSSARARLFLCAPDSDIFG
jgi:hypothetical protein